MEKLIANISFGRGVRTEALQGREYLVAPVSMIVEGVLAGSQGPVLYESAEIVKSVPAWNHKPITVGHPETNGTKVSGCTQTALETVGLGIILNARWKPQTKKLVAEAWFDKSRFAVVPGGDRIEAALLSNTKLEVSTGLFVDRVPVQNGQHNGKSYDAKAVNYAPDHLAILLDEPGACSIADGAGLLVNKSTDAKSQADCHPLVINAMSLDKKVDRVRTAIYAAYETQSTETTPGIYAYIEDIFSSYVIFSQSKKGEFTTYKQNYEVVNEEVTLIGNPMKVTRKVTYTPVVNQATNMKREDLLATLGESHKEFVANLSDEQVAALAALKATPAPAPEAPKAPAPVVANSLAELAANASPVAQAQLNDAIYAAGKMRTDFVEKITTNKKCQFTADELQAWPLSALEKLASLATNAQDEVAPAPVVAPTPFYFGSPAPLTANSGKVTETGFGAPSTL